MHLCSACNRRTTNALDDDDDDEEADVFTDLEQKTGSAVLIGGDTQKTFSIENNGTTVVVVRCPNAGGTWRLKMWGLEHFGAVEEGMIKCVGFPVARVAKNRHDLHRSIGVAAES